MVKEKRFDDEGFHSLIWMIIDLVAIIISAFVYPAFGIFLAVSTLIVIIILMIRKRFVESKK